MLEFPSSIHSIYAKVGYRVQKQERLGGTSWQRGTQGDASRQTEDATKTWSKLYEQNEGEVKSHVTECRLMDMGV